MRESPKLGRPLVEEAARPVLLAAVRVVVADPELETSPASASAPAPASEPEPA